ncbi:unnamed protein product [Schistosoma margrebowiei]|uniref:Uncharacterized protein n=3 Tax=Schistosoma margrebowiei TaxID=48269 RepID=A0AA84ZK19_9TREM|nr:unnamed protein product [Schistosoma margrebowiei]
MIRKGYNNRSKSVCSAPAEEKSSNNERKNSMIAKCVSKKSVKFPGECNLVTRVIDPVDPWLNRQCLSPAELINVYKLQCNLSLIQPLYSVISQLQSIDLRQSLERKHVFNLKGCQLNGGHIDMLEYVFKYVQFQYVNLENSNLDDESVESLHEILSYYETCTGLCLARNPNVTSTGWIPVAFLFREVPYMEWLDLRENNLGLTFVQILSSSLRISRKEFKPKQFTKESFDRNCNRLSEKLSDKDTSKTSKNVSISESNLSSSKTLPFHSRGLHLGCTGINGKLLHILIPGIRLGCITDLRLPDNGITGSDAKFLVPLLRYSSHLKYLDLSRNLLGDLGCSTISQALASPCFSSEILNSDENQRGLIRLFLSENMITRSSMNKLATGLIRCTRLTTLQLSGNLNIGSSGLFDLKSSLISCPCLKRLGIAFCGIDHDGAACITEILIKTTSRFKVIDLTGNPIGIENCLALLNSSAYLDEKVRIIGLEFQPSSLMQYARKLSEKENNSLLHQSNDNSQVQSDGLNPDRDYQRPKHKNRRHSQISSSKHSIYGKSKFTSLPTIDYKHKPHSELNPKYLWGDSSDDEDRVNDSDDNSVSVITKTNRNYLSEQNYKQTSENEWTKHHSIS